MSRKFASISMEDFKKKVDAVSESKLSEDRYEFLNDLVEKVGKDMKVKFDFENVIDGDDQDSWPELGGLLGYRQENNGLTYLGLAAGGDWESPVYFMIYWDGKKLRVYVPTDGNPWNRTTKEAYGNDEEADLKDFKKHYKVSSSDEDDEEDFIDVSSEVQFNHRAIKNDFMKRILPV